MSDPYLDFLTAKAKLAPSQGLAIDVGEVNPALKDFVRCAVVPWAMQGGRRAIFSSFGLHKTSTQIELARLYLKHAAAGDMRCFAGGREVATGPALIVVPLGVRQEFLDEARERFTGDYAVRLHFVRRTEEVDPDAINLTNYESVRDGKIDPSGFGFSSLDEAAVLRGFGGTKTFREFMRVFDPVPFRFVATATPDPNDYIELLAYAAYLGVMEVGEAKTRFFKRDSQKADRLTIHPHKEREFWLWVASWALFVRRPSDLGYSDDGYVLPALNARWHEVKSDIGAGGTERDGQHRLFRNAALGVSEAASEKRDSLSARIAKMLEIRAEEPGAHRIIWHDLEAERSAIEASVPGVASIYGAQDIEKNEAIALDFKHGRVAELATKPVMSGAGCNFQHHCHKAVYLGIGFKFHDFIQSIHRLARFGQAHRVDVDLITTEAEREVKRSLLAKWARHDEQAERMAKIIQEYGLAGASLAKALARGLGVTRHEETGLNWTAIHNDCVVEMRTTPSDSVGLILTSVPFGTQYEYTPSYNDFGHTDDNAHFWRQMDFLTPELFRALKPGRICAIHIKDRIVPSGLSGMGFQTQSPFHAEAIFHYQRHGFGFLGMKTIVTDVVRENNQTYRLGWTEQCKDGTKMGCGLPEYLLLFRKPQTDRTNGYADDPVTKEKPWCDDSGAPAPFDTEANWRHPIPNWPNAYSRAKWQMDAHGFARSSGDRPLTSAELRTLAHNEIFQRWREFSLRNVYDFTEHVRIAEEMDYTERLPSTFMLLPPHSWHPDVWSDVTRMRTLNGAQYAAGREMHLCPLQLDIADRTIAQFSMKGETVLDPFAGLFTVPLRALKLGRVGIGIELAEGYWRDGVAYLRAAEEDAATPSLFDLLAAG